MIERISIRKPSKGCDQDMLKKTLVFVILLLSTSLFAMAAPSSTPLVVSLDDQELHFTTAPRLINGVPMVPMREFFESVGANVKWYGETQQIAAYKNNMYIRLQINNSIAYRNGKSVKLKQAPMVTESRTLIPADFIAKTFEIDYKYADGKITMHTTIPLQYRYHNDMFYKTMSIKSLNINFALPYGWKLLSENTYGIKDEYDDYKISFKKASNPNAISVVKYKNNLKDTLLKTHKQNIVMTGDKPFKTENNQFEAIQYIITNKNKSRFYMVYMIPNDADFLVIQAEYANDADAAYVKGIFEYILRSFNFSAKNVETTQEHYIEYDPFFTIGTTLNQTFISNQEVKSEFAISGKIDHYETVSGLYALVTKGTTSMSFDVSLNDKGVFDGKLYTPFGIGKHNIQLWVRYKDTTADQKLLQFSAINISREVTRYLIPSRFVQSNTVEISSLANYLTYKYSSEYLRARELYTWVINEIKYLPESAENADRQKTAYDVLIEKTGSSFETSALLAAMLRSIGIPTKLYKGQAENHTYYFLEAMINGSWMVLDPASQLYLNWQNSLVKASMPTDAEATIKPPTQEDDQTPLTAFVSFFYLNNTLYKGYLEKVELLSY